MTLWLALIVLLLMALAFVVWPLYSRSGGLNLLMAAVIVATVGLSAALYHNIGQPGVPSGAGSAPDVDEMVASLEARLQLSPDDVGGWLMLGRSYQTMKRYDDAVSAFEKAIELEQGKNAQTLVALGIALLERAGGEMPDRAASLFENALALAPNNANALFYGGGAAARRGNTSLAADRWEILMGQNAPPEIRDLLQRKINEWRGLAPPMPQAVAAGSLVSIRVSIAGTALQALSPDTTVYIIARDPAQPAPPVAVTRRRLSDLPVTVDLGDTDAMMPNRLLSAFSEIEILARASRSGAPMAQSGDWSGSLITSTNSGQIVELVIDKQLP